MEASEDQSPDASSQPEISFIVDGSFLHDNTKANEYYRNQIAKFLFYLAKFSTMRITIGVKTKNASRLSVMLDEKENIQNDLKLLKNQVISLKNLINQRHINNGVFKAFFKEDLKEDGSLKDEFFPESKQEVKEKVKEEFKKKTKKKKVS